MAKEHSDIANLPVRSSGDGEPCHSLSRQRHAMGSPHLHRGRGDGPNRPLRIELGPLSRPQLTWPGKQEWEQLQSDSCTRLPLE
jgi:hypothetical protein